MVMSKERQPERTEYLGGKSKNDIEYEEGLDWVSELLEESKGSLLLVVNGAGPDSGKTRFVGDSMKIAKEKGRPVIDYEGDLRGVNDTFRAMLERYGGQPVIIKTMEQKVEIKKESLKKLFRKRTEKLLRSEVGPFLEEFGYDLDEIKFVNISSSARTSWFPEDRFPAEIGVKMRI